MGTSPFLPSFFPSWCSSPSSSPPPGPAGTCLSASAPDTLASLLYAPPAAKSLRAYGESKYRCHGAPPHSLPCTVSCRHAVEVDVQEGRGIPILASALAGGVREGGRLRFQPQPDSRAHRAFCASEREVNASLFQPNVEGAGCDRSHRGWRPLSAMRSRVEERWKWMYRYGSRPGERKGGGRRG